jgi:dolichol-phosphate mannosyltransferase
MKLDSIFGFFKNPQIHKFLIIGLFNGIVVLILTEIFTSYLGIFYLISALISYEISIISSFFMNDKWTFGNILKTSKKQIRLIKFNLFYLMGLGINGIVLLILTDLVGLHYLVAECISLIVVFSFNYTTSKKISFKN